jgi:hypothetical protein
VARNGVAGDDLMTHTMKTGHDMTTDYQGKTAKQWHDLCVELRKEHRLYRDYGNALIVFVRDFLPLCPAKSRKMFARAVVKGRKMADYQRRKMLREVGVASCSEAIKGAARYEAIRLLTPAQFSSLWMRNVESGIRFDDLVDKLVEKMVEKMAL